MVPKNPFSPESSPARGRSSSKLLAERRYEEALDLLSAPPAEPDAIEISRGIQLLKQRLVRRYLHQIGNLDHVPNLAISQRGRRARKLTEEQTEVLRLIDGISSYGDIAHESRLGRFETFRTLSTLVFEGVLTASPDASPADSGDHSVVPRLRPPPWRPARSRPRRTSFPATRPSHRRDRVRQVASAGSTDCDRGPRRRRRGLVRHRVVIGGHPQAGGSVTAPAPAQHRKRPLPRPSLPQRRTRRRKLPSRAPPRGARPRSLSSCT